MKIKRWKGCVSLLLAVALVLTGVTLPQTKAEASTAYMRKLGVTFGIKKGKPYHFKQKLTGVGSKDITWTMRDFKDRKSKKSGYRELTVVLDFKSNFSLSPVEVDAVTSTAYSRKNHNSGANMWYAVVDGETGRDVEEKSDLKVKVKSKRLNYKYNTFYGSDLQTWQNVVYLWSSRLTITYPADYEDLCIGFGGGNVLSGDLTKADGGFWTGKTPFGKTTHYTKGKANSRWVRISSLR